MHVECQRYHKKIINAYSAVWIKEEIDGTTAVATYLCKPGNKIKQEETPQCVINDTPHDKRTHLVPPVISSEQAETYRERVKTKYKVYCQEAMAVQGNNIINLKQTAEFDFVPSFMNIGIPLNNPTYTVTILFLLLSSL
jgi:hypothetical protein